MRIIAGKFGGRTFHESKGHKTHPMSEKVRGALFNALGDIADQTFLDAFAGSGALSFEAVSRGAKHVTAVEIDKQVYSHLPQSIKTLQVENVIKVIRANVGGWSFNNPDVKFDIVLLDPPYDDIKPPLLDRLATHAKPSGVIVLLLPPNADFVLPSTVYRLLSTKSYGDAQLAFYRKI